jgi:hypothetical protein
VIDPDGQVVVKQGLGWTFTSGPDAGKGVIQVAVERTMAASGDASAIPDKAKPIAQLMKRGDLGKALAAARNLPTKPPELESWRDKTVNRLDEMKKAQLDKIDALMAEGKKFQAFLEAEAFLRMFGGEKEAKGVRAKMDKLRSDPVVRKELGAKEIFWRGAEIADTAKQQPSVAVQITAYVEKLRREYGETKFGQAAGALTR